MLVSLCSPSSVSSWKLCDPVLDLIKSQVFNEDQIRAATACLSLMMALLDDRHWCSEGVQQDLTEGKQIARGDMESFISHSAAINSWQVVTSHHAAKVAFKSTLSIGGSILNQF
ncbi:hypothetical protein BDE02_14G084900 [Populus trichocarpa]|nr:hypothetical protein BDE02_14G084900 [Populus trichocarpa]KAI5564828.1 hypothetical protein BDE02_14G084900 [Populus trichocarpa]